MQIYAMKFFNFLRFGEKNNTIVFDLTSKQKEDLKSGKITMDEIYESVMKDPVSHIEAVKKRGIEKLLGFTGVIGGDPDKSNGAGKSSILEGVCYAHYEKISRKTANTDKIEKAGLAVVTKINGEIPKNVKASYVEELFDDNERIYRLKRGREFTKSHKNSTPILEFERIHASSVDSQAGHRTSDTKEAISDVITMDYDVFCNSQMFAQNDAGKYLTGTDKTRKEMLISLLRLENVVAGCLESIRSRKNKQDKKVDSIKTMIGMLEEKICEIYSKFSKTQSSVFDKLMPSKTVELIEGTIALERIKIEGLQREILNKDKSILELEKSDKITKVEGIKEEGRKVQKEKKDKEAELLKQTAEWNKLLEETEENIGKKEKAHVKIIKEISEVNQKITERSKEVGLFNQEKYDKGIKLVEKAKQIKPTIETDLKTANEKRDAIVSRQSEINTLINNVNNDLEKLEKQVQTVNGDKFICSECKSLVSKEHLIEKIKENKTLREGRLEEKTKVDGGKKAVDEEIAALNVKLERVREYLLEENTIKSTMAVYLENQKQLVDLNGFMATQKELKETLEGEIKTLSDKKIEYSSKCSSIKILFDDGIAELRLKLNNLVAALKTAEEETNKLQKEIKALKDEKQALSDTVTALNEKIGSLNKEKENITKQEAELNQKIDSLVIEQKILERYLLLEDIYGLEGIQTRIVKKFLPLLNVFIKEFLDILSEGELSVRMFINERSKVDVEITGGTSDSFEMLSGGEKMIVRLATDIGLALLSFSRSAQKPEIICLDEIFSNLDESRTQSVFNMLKRLSEKFSRVLVISHKQEINKRIHSQIIIEKASGKFGLSEIKRIT